MPRRRSTCDAVGPRKGRDSSAALATYVRPAFGHALAPKHGLGDRLHGCMACFGEIFASCLRTKFANTLRKKSAKRAKDPRQQPLIQKDQAPMNRMASLDPDSCFAGAASRKEDGTRE
jgi:hypothetical protein